MRGWFDNDGKTAETKSNYGQRSSDKYDITIVMVMMTSLLQAEDIVVMNRSNKGAQSWRGEQTALI